MSGKTGAALLVKCCVCIPEANHKEEKYYLLTLIIVHTIIHAPDVVIILVTNQGSFNFKNMFVKLYKISLPNHIFPQYSTKEKSNILTFHKKVCRIVSYLLRENFLKETSTEDRNKIEPYISAYKLKLIIQI